MRIRSIKPEWMEDERLLMAGLPARTLSVCLILLADDYGNGRGNAELLRARAMPSETQDLFDAAYKRLVEIGFVDVYEVRGQTYFHIRNWSKHQRVDKPGKPMVPPPEPDEAAEPRSSAAYFVRSGATGLIKIGTSTDPIRRLVELSKCSPEPLELLAIGGSERDHHRSLESSRAFGEWFRPTPDVLAKIREVGGNPDQPIATCGYDGQKRVLEKVREDDAKVPDILAPDLDLRILGSGRERDHVRALEEHDSSQSESGESVESDRRRGSDFMLQATARSWQGYDPELAMIGAKPRAELLRALEAIRGDPWCQANMTKCSPKHVIRKWNDYSTGAKPIQTPAQKPSPANMAALGLVLSQLAAARETAGKHPKDSWERTQAENAAAELESRAAKLRVS